MAVMLLGKDKEEGTECARPFKWSTYAKVHDQKLKVFIFMDMYILCNSLPAKITNKVTNL